MKCKNLYWVTSKEPSYKTSYEGQNRLQRGGYYKKIEQDDHITWTPLGMQLRDFVKRVWIDAFIQKGYFETLGGMPELAFRGDVKSYKHLGRGSYQVIDLTRSETSGKLGLFGAANNEVIESFSLHETEEEAKEIKNAFFSKFKCQLEEYSHSLYVSDENAGFSDRRIYGVLDNGNPIHKCCSCGKIHDVDFATKGRNGEILNAAESDEAALEYIHTPDCKTIQDLMALFDQPGHAFLKTIIVEIQGTFYAVLLRGDRTLDVEKVARAVGVNASIVRMADKDVFTQSTGIEAGFIGPVGLKDKNVKILVDEEVKVASGLIAGGNRTDYHVAHVREGRDYTSDVSGDFKEWIPTDGCQNCGHQTFDTISAIELCRFVVGEADGSLTRFPYKVIGSNGKEQMSYVVKSHFAFQSFVGWLAEQGSQGEGLYFGKYYSPFQMGILCMNSDDEVQSTLANQLYSQLNALGYRPYLDDSKERGGVKFSNFDLTGASIRITVGKMASEGQVEFKTKGNDLVETIAIEALIPKIEGFIK